MIAGYIFIGACFTLMGLALTVLTREVFAERARRRNEHTAPQDFTEKVVAQRPSRGSGYGSWGVAHHHAPAFRAK